MKKLTLLVVASVAALTVKATDILPGSETSLQTIINNSVTGTTINVNTNQLSNDSYFTAQANPAAYMIIEIAGYAGNNAFGIYQQGSPNNKVEVFAGAVSGPSGQVSIAIPVGWGSFGFYLSNPNVGFTWYSDPTLNGGGDHFVTFGGAAGAHVQVGSTSANFGVNDYIIGIEDLNLGDQDYNDMVVLVQNVNPVPESGMTLALVGLGLGAMVAVRRRLR